MSCFHVESVKFGLAHIAEKCYIGGVRRGKVLVDENSERRFAKTGN